MISSYLYFIFVISTPTELLSKSYLNCQITETPSISISDIYKIVPDQQSEFQKNIWDAGLVGAVEAPPITWVIDQELQSINTPEDQQIYKITLLNSSSIKGSTITDSGTVKIFSLDRINHSLMLTTIFSEDTISKWKIDHGKPFPSVWTWQEHCDFVNPM